MGQQTMAATGQTRALRIPAQLVGAVSTGVLMLVLPLQGVAQDSDAGGLTASLNVSQQLRVDDNAALSTGDTQTALSAVTRLGFNLRSQTRTQTLAFDVGTGLRFGSTSDDTTDDFTADIIDPTFSLSYSREAADATLQISARYAQTDIGYSRTLEDIVTAGLPLPEDFTDLTGTGTRTAIGLDATLALRTDRPFGITFRAGISDLSYEDTTASDLVDSTRTTLGATAKFTITPVLSATLGVTGTRFEAAGAATRETLSVRAGASIARPDGSYDASLSVSDTEEGRQYGLSLSRDIALRNATLAGTIGASRSAGGGTYLSGGLDYHLETPSGALSVGIDRSLSSDSNDGEEVLTSLSLGANYALTPRSSLGVDLTLARSEATVTGLGTDVASLGLQYNYTLSRDWSLQASYNYELHAPDAGADASSNSIGVSVSRTFDLRF